MSIDYDYVMPLPYRFGGSEPRKVSTPFTTQQVRDIRSSNESLEALCKKYNRGKTTIWNVRNRTTYKGVQ